MKKIYFIKTLLALLLMATSLIAKAQATYLDFAIPYEGKRSTSIKVFQSLDGYALANEVSDKLAGSYYGKVVMVMGYNFYEGQIIKIKKPYQVGFYKYETKNGDHKTVPILNSKEAVEVKNMYNQIQNAK